MLSDVYEDEAFLVSNATVEVTPEAEHNAGGDATLQLFVLVHGILGCSRDFDIWERRMQMRGRQNWRILKTSSITENVKFTTQISCGRGPYRLQELADDLVTEVAAWIVNCMADTDRIDLHFVCHSLGGLIVRTALPKLNTTLQSRLDDRLSSVSYGHILTLNSPHIGVQGKRFGHRFRNWFKSKDLHKQLTLQDYETLFLLELADPQGEYHHHLRRFKHRTAVAASHWDLVVPFCTAAISATNPFPRPSLLPSWFGSSYWRVDAAIGFQEDSQVPIRLAAKLAVPIPESTADLVSHVHKLDSALDPCEFWGSLRTWRATDDGDISFVAKMLTGIASASWRRIVFTLHWTGVSPHTFAIGKPQNAWSEEFIDLLIDVLEEP